MIVASNAEHPAQPLSGANPPPPCTSSGIAMSVLVLSLPTMLMMTPCCGLATCAPIEPWPASPMLLKSNRWAGGPAPTSTSLLLLPPSIDTLGNDFGLPEDGSIGGCFNVTTSPVTLHDGCAAVISALLYPRSWQVPAVPGVGFLIVTGSSGEYVPVDGVGNLTAFGR